MDLLTLTCRGHFRVPLERGWLQNATVMVSKPFGPRDAGTLCKNKLSWGLLVSLSLSHVSPGTVSNIPIGMVTDQFGMVGLLTYIRTAELDPNLVALAPGIDLTTLGLNLNSPE